MQLSRSNGGFGFSLLADSEPTGLRGWFLEVYQQKLRIKTAGDNGFTTIKNLMTFDRNGNIRIGTELPSYPLDVQSPDAIRVIQGKYLGSTSIDAEGVYGESTPEDGYGIGGAFSGGWRGVVGTSAVGSYSGNTYGVYGSSAGGSTGTRIGVWGYAAGGALSWAGYFSGNVFDQGH